MNINKEKVALFMMKERLNQRQLAQISGLSQSTINLILLHKRRPNTATIGRLANALKVDPTEILE